MFKFYEKSFKCSQYKKYISHSGYNPLATINIYRVVGEEKNTSPKTKLAIEI